MSGAVCHMMRGCGSAVACASEVVETKQKRMAERGQQSGHELGRGILRRAWDKCVRIEWIKLLALKRDGAHIMHARCIDCAPPEVFLYLRIFST